MPNYLLIKNIEVQNANAVAGFTWGFPSVTHFLGFVHSLERKLKGSDEFGSVQSLDGVGVISHNQKIHLYGDYQDRFVQNKGSRAMYFENNGSNAGKKGTDAAIIEEGKMNMTVSLLIPYTGRISENMQEDFIKWLTKQCYLQRLAGGTILSIKNIQPYTIDDSDNGLKTFRQLKHELLPGFILKDRSETLAEHYQQHYSHDDTKDMLDAWLDFGALKYKARPQCQLVTQHLSKKGNEALNDIWQSHLQQYYEQNAIPESLQQYFNDLPTKGNKELKKQWESYINPSEKTNADWESIPKPYKGWLVPVMNGYKAITPVYANAEVDNTRDDETDVCFVEASHSVAQWLGINRIRKLDDLTESLWQYHYEENWYLCQKMKPNLHQETQTVNAGISEQDNYR